MNEMKDYGIITPDMINTATILDVKDAYGNPLRDSDRITRDWIYSVDPETMEAVKSFWRTLPGDKSLYDAFVSVLKMAE